MRVRAGLLAVSSFVVLAGCSHTELRVVRSFDNGPQSGSPRMIAYTHHALSSDAGPWGVYVFDLDSSSTHVLATDSWAYAWIPGTDSLLMRWSMAPLPRVISARTGLGRTLAIDVWPGSISPDHQWIASTGSADAGGGFRPTVTLQSFATGEIHDITPDSMTYAGPSWSPSGDRLAVAGGSAREPGIFIIDSNGTPLRRIVEHVGDVDGPLWSPRGDLVAWGDVRGLHVVDTLGTGERFVATGGEACWEPDGDALVYVTKDRDGSDRLFEYRLSTGRTRQLTH